MKQQKGITVFSSIHDMNIAMRYCDYIIALKQGTVAAVGKPQEVLTKSILEDLFRVKVNICQSADGEPYIQCESRVKNTRFPRGIVLFHNKTMINFIFSCWL